MAALAVDSVQDLRKLLVRHAAIIDDQLLDRFDRIRFGGLKVLGHGLRHGVADSALCQEETVAVQPRKCRQRCLHLPDARVEVLLLRDLLLVHLGVVQANEVLGLLVKLHLEDVIAEE